MKMSYLQTWKRKGLSPPKARHWPDYLPRADRSLSGAPDEGVVGGVEFPQLYFGRIFHWHFNILVVIAITEHL